MTTTRPTAGPRAAAASVVTADVLRARAYLSRAVEPPAAELLALVDELGPVAAADRVAHDAPAELRPHLRPGYRRGEDPLALGQRDLDQAAVSGAQLLVPEQPDWPHHAWQPHRPPPTEPRDSAPVALWVRGNADLDVLTRRAVVVTGACHATPYGLHIAGECGVELGRIGIPVISGGALGVDAAAHRGALAADGRTIAVLAAGIDRPHSSAHGGRLDRIVPAGGLLISEYPPDCVTARRRFRARDRLLAVFATHALVVVETIVRGSAMGVARSAHATGRRVLAVPGPLTSAQSAGCHLLIREGIATLAPPLGDLVTELETPRDEPARRGADDALDRPQS